MDRVVTLPPESQTRPDGSYAGGWWRSTDDQGRILCELCPRACHMKPGDRGFCFVRENRDGEMLLTTYGRSTGFCIDPIEKKPLNHFFPGTSVLSFGTAGCNLGCKFCQNWDISKSREVERLSEQATPQMIAQAAADMGCRSVAYTYNDPIIWAEYAIDVAAACRELGIKSVAVTAGYITEAARAPFFNAMDATNVDLKSFTEDFYYSLTSSHLQPVLDTLKWLKHETDVWFEITNLIIPQANDSPAELGEMCDWVLEQIGDDVPIHFSAFHPDFRMTDRPRTPHETLLTAQEIARSRGIKYAYVGNVDDQQHQSTYCPQCEGLLIERNWYELGAYQLNGNLCGHCGATITGHFDQTPGDWGRKRLPVKIANYTPPQPTVIPLTHEEPNPVQPAERPELTISQSAAIHHAACQTVAAHAVGAAAALTDPTLDGTADWIVMGAFVTLKRQDRLRACCGVLGQPMKLSEALTGAARRTATEDSRFPTLSSIELPYLDLEVSLLYDFQPVQAQGKDRIGAVEIGKHGLVIQRGNQSGLLLPVVAVEHGMDAEGFLKQVCRKAGLPGTAWQDDETKLQVFETSCTGNPFDTGVLNDQTTSYVAPLNDDQLQNLVEHCRHNLVAMTTGATPNYYLNGCPDAMVRAITLRVHDAQDNVILSSSKTSMRQGIPLQATLHELVEGSARSLQQQRVDASFLQALQPSLLILNDPAMHGTVAAADLRGIDTAQRALLVTENNRNAWAYDPSADAQTCLQSASRDAQVQSSELASVFSFAAISSREKTTFANVPRPQSGSSIRPPAVAGTFYPAESTALKKLVTSLLGKPAAKKTSWPAVMLPHAGLIYSGAIAAQTLKQIEIPETVIVIGPKHTQLGVQWAVAPHQRWSIPGAELAADPALAQQLADQIDGLQLDAAAHQQEHAIEVELPLLAQLAPQSRVVGIALGGGSQQQCLDFASGLAEVIRQQPQPPLLIISSDMNHFASDQENRRLDEIALTALDTLDPATVFQTVTEHNISMCGLRPAVIVLETLRQLNQLSKSERTGYATSAEVSHDTSRVVGYAGMLFG
ncbi:MAG: AmmeMemoRadiSam system radical SAM enzyme [Pirellulaceae bacterium]